MDEFAFGVCVWLGSALAIWVSLQSKPFFKLSKFIFKSLNFKADLTRLSGMYFFKIIYFIFYTVNIDFNSIF